MLSEGQCGPGGGGEHVGRQWVVFVVAGWLYISIRVVVTQVCTHGISAETSHTQVLVKPGKPEEALRMVAGYFLVLLLHLKLQK